jgi:hypothetical protein
MWRHILWISIVLVSLSYVGSYLILSRIGFAEADQRGERGFFFFYPDGTEPTRSLNLVCIEAYRPLIALDNWIGTGRDPWHECGFQLGR